MKEQDAESGTKFDVYEKPCCGQEMEELVRNEKRPRIITPATTTSDFIIAHNDSTKELNARWSRRGPRPLTGVHHDPSEHREYEFQKKSSTPHRRAHTSTTLRPPTTINE